MRKLILGFCCLGLATTSAWAQQPAAGPQIEPLVQIHHRGPACDNCTNCAPSSVCVRVPEAKTKVVYGSRCVEYCLPSCSLLGGGCDSDCGAPCGKVRNKHVLLKKVVDDCPTTKCVPQPACVPGAPGHATVVPSGPAIVTEPAPFAGKKMPQASVTPR
jgi:hypothetical protein